LEPIESQ
jgi:hypothetical protein